MKRKIVLTLMPFIVATAFVLGCGHRTEEVVVDEPVAEASIEEVETQAPKNILKVYYSTADASQILSKDVEYEEGDETIVIKNLIDSSVLPSTVEVNGILLTTKEDIKTVTVDFNKPFIDYLNTLSNPAEFGTTAAIANTYLDYFKADRFVFRVNDKEVRTNNKLYSAYYSKYEGTENPEFGKFTTEVVKDTTNEMTKASRLFETVKSETENVIVSPTMLKLSLFNMYDGIAEDNKPEIAAYIEDVDNTEKALQAFASKEKDNFNSSLIYYDSEINEVSFEESYLKALAPYNTAVKGIDYTKSNATKDVNNYINDLTFDKEINYFDKVDKNSSIYDFTALNINKPLLNTFEGTEEGVFYNGDNTESTVNYYSGIQNVPYFETDEIKGVVENYEESGYSLVLIQPKRVNIDYTNIDFATLLDYYSIEEENVLVKLPEFEVDSTLSLSSPLKKLEVGQIFDFGKVNFEKMFTTNTQSFISDLIQYNKFSYTAKVEKLEEKIKPTQELILDKPFVFMVYDNTLDEVVYMGQINNFENMN